jgi:glucosylceramidase
LAGRTQGPTLEAGRRRSRIHARRRRRNILLSTLGSCALLAWIFGLVVGSSGGGSAGDPPRSWTVAVVQSSTDGTQRFAELPQLRFVKTKALHVPVINVDDTVRYQRFEGLGAAITDTAAWLIKEQLPSVTRTLLMRALYGSEGIRLNFALLPIGATDFTATGQPYTYDDLPSGQSDPQLQHFSIAHDENYIIPLLKHMVQLDPDLKILATPWTAPAWMKANDAFDNLGWRGALLPSAYQPFANYFVRFLRAYASQGVPISAISPENEPRAPAPYPSMTLWAPNEAQWIVKNLVPALRAAKLNPQVYASNTGWGHPEYPQGLAASQARSALSGGIAWHCYDGAPNAMGALHQSAPDLGQIVTECSPGLTPYPISEVLIGSARNWASIIALWNLALDPHGGPVQEPNIGCNHCTALATIDEQQHTAKLRLAYYQLGQLSKFVQPGAQRVQSNHFVRYYRTSTGFNRVTPGVDNVAFVNPDGTRVLMAYNSATAPETFAVRWMGRSFTYRLPAQATVTFIWNRALP